MTSDANLVFEASPAVTLAIAGSDHRFPVRRVFCIGRNYAAHAREMGHDPDREPPFFFTKWAETVVQASAVPYPPETRNYQYEGELVVALGKPGRAIRVEEARAHIFGYAAGLDMTRRDLQLAAKELGRPWDVGKNVEASAPVGLLHRVADIGRLDAGPIVLRVNGVVKQQSDISQMLWSSEEIIAHLSRYYVLQPGDLIFTGTPEGVGAVQPGDRIELAIDGLEPLRVEITSPLE